VISLWRSVCAGVGLNEFVEVISLNKFFYLVFQSLEAFGCMTIVAVILAMFRCICIVGSTIASRSGLT